MQVLNTIADFKQYRRGVSGSVGVVLTMGALHAGHLELVKTARAENQTVITTIFVNPLQFSANEDFAAYPRRIEPDLQLFRDAGVDAVFLPKPEEIYPEDFSTYIHVEEVSLGLEGERRPGHFRGVATVVAKLFHLTQPTRSYFGQKDAQQVVVLRQMVRDLAFPLEVIPLPTFRETDGLAMSSRNQYLTPEERLAAPIIWQAIKAAASVYEAGERDPNILRASAAEVIHTEPLAQLDYVAINDPKTLRGILEPTDQPMLLSMTVKLGKTYLLDNSLLPFHLNNRENLTQFLGSPSF